MTKFQDITLGWNGNEYTIPANRVMGAIVRVEDVVTLVELQQYGERQVAPLGKLASAYATLLRYAGAQIEDEDVYVGMFSDMDAARKQKDVVAAIQTLLTLMMPPGLSESADDGEGARPPGNSPGDASRSSRKRSRRRSRGGGSRGQSSGNSTQSNSGG